MEINKKDEKVVVKYKNNRISIYTKIVQSVGFWKFHPVN
jgi:hypothetical protein